MLVDFDTPIVPPPPKEEDENELNPLLPPKPFPNPLLKKSSLSKAPKPPKLPKPRCPPFLCKNFPKISSSSSLSNPKSEKKFLKISSALWKLKLVPCFGASNP